MIVQENTAREPGRVRPDPMRPRPFRILEVQQEIAECFTWILEPADGGKPLSFQAGQFNMLYMFGQGEVPISISSNSADPDRLGHTIRAVGSVTHAFERLQAGDVIGLRGPFGTGWPINNAKTNDVLIIAGGLGLAPLRPAIYQLLSAPEEFGKLTLLYGARSPETVLYHDELMSWATSGKMGVDLTVDRADRSWSGPVGVVTDLIDNIEIDPVQTIAMLCGPEIMMRFCTYALLDRGLTDHQIYLSMERNMKCAMGLCGRCQYGPHFMCKDGPVFPYYKIKDLLGLREV